MVKMKLSKLEEGTTAKIIKICSKGAFNRRIRDMGIRPGATVLVAKKAPLGDPLNIKINDLSLAIRKTEAEQIIVEIV